jgi:ferritin-like metal-binding protein YciE
MAISNLQDLLVHELEDLHSVETQLISALPKLTREASNDELKKALVKHFSVTEKQLKRLDNIAEFLSFPKKNTCRGLEGILSEGEKTLKDIKDTQTKDAAIVAAAQRAEHYEIAGYGTAAQFARDLGLTGVADLLEETLNEEKAADEDLSKLAKGGFFKTGLNEQAVRPE